jgi:addiction module RelB/DinJ family antitoxin
LLLYIKQEKYKRSRTFFKNHTYTKKVRKKFEVFLHNKPKNSIIQIRVEEDLKKKAESLFSDLGLDTTSAIRLFLKQAVMRNGIPFEIKRIEELQKDNYKNQKLTDE